MTPLKAVGLATSALGHCTAGAMRSVGNGEAIDASATLLDMCRRDWAVRVLCAANTDERHYSFPYPHRLGGFEMIESPHRRSDVLHHGDTAAQCLINAADAVWPDLPNSVRAELGERP